MVWAVSRRLWAAFGIALSAGASLHCSSNEHPPSYVAQGGSTGGQDGAGGGLALDDAGTDAALCGNQQVPAITDPPGELI